MSDTATRPRRWVGVGEPRPYRLEELEDALGRPTAHELAQVLDVHAKQIYRWREYGLTTPQAVHCAEQLDVDPGDLWEAWPDPRLS